MEVSENQNQKKKEGGPEKKKGGGGGVKIHPFHLPWIRAWLLSVFHESHFSIVLLFNRQNVAM